MVKVNRGGKSNTGRHFGKGGKNNATGKVNKSGKINKVTQVVKIGKPQRSKKHKKLKIVDPDNTGRRINKKGSHKINSRPSNPDEQELTRGFRELVEAQEKAKSMSKGRKRNKFKQDGNHVFTIEKGMSRPLKSIPDYKQKKGECERAFLNRVEKQTKVVIATSQFEDKFGVDVAGVDKDGQIIMSKTKKMSKKKKERLKAKKEKVKMKKVAKETAVDFSSLQDEVGFGERVDAPPTITAKPRKSQVSDSMFKPGKKDLLLKEIMSGNSSHGGMQIGISKEREVGKTIKRKQLSISQQRKTDAERERAIDMYRQMKLAKMKPIS